MGQLGKNHKRIPIAWECPVFLLANFTLALVDTNMENVTCKFVTSTLVPPYL